MTIGEIKRGDTVYTVEMATVFRWYVVDVFTDASDGVKREKAYVYRDMPNWFRSDHLEEMETQQLLRSVDEALELANLYVRKQEIALKKENK